MEGARSFASSAADRSRSAAPRRPIASPFLASPYRASPCCIASPSTASPATASISTSESPTSSDPTHGDASPGAALLTPSAAVPVAPAFSVAAPPAFSVTAPPPGASPVIRVPAELIEVSPALSSGGICVHPGRLWGRPLSSATPKPRAAKSNLAADSGCAGSRCAGSNCADANTANSPAGAAAASRLDTCYASSAEPPRPTLRVQSSLVPVQVGGSGGARPSPLSRSSFSLGGFLFSPPPPLQLPSPSCSDVGSGVGSGVAETDVAETDVAETPAAAAGGMASPSSVDSSRPSRTYLVTARTVHDAQDNDAEASPRQVVESPPAQAPAARGLVTEWL